MSFFLVGEYLASSGDGKSVYCMVDVLSPVPWPLPDFQFLMAEARLYYDVTNHRWCGNGAVHTTINTAQTEREGKEGLFRTLNINLSLLYPTLFQHNIHCTYIVHWNPQCTCM